MQSCYLDGRALARVVDILKTHFPDEVERACSAAEQHCKGLFAPVNSMAAGQWTALGQPVDWTYNPTADPEFTWLINRFWHLKDLGLAWATSGERRYVDTFREHIDGWIAQNPVPWQEDWASATHFQRLGPWRLLETGLRAESWVMGWQLVAPALQHDDAFVARFKISLAEHADWLAMRLGSTDINHAMMHMLGLLVVATALPEHPSAPWWRQLAMERFELCLARQVRADGVHAELTPGYHNVSVELFVKPILIGRASGHPMPLAFERQVCAMAQFSAGTIHADGQTAAISDWEGDDSGRVALAQLGLMADDETLVAQGAWSPGLLWLFGEKAWAARARIGSERQPPCSVAFPESGYFMCRDEHNSLLFDAAAMGGAHGHADALAFAWTRDNTPLLIDPGRYTYEEGEWRRWFKSSRAHSTVEIDSLDQSVYASTQAWDEPTAVCKLHRHWFGDALDFVDAEHDGYHRLAEPVSHRRWLAFLHGLNAVVVVDWLDGRGEHAFAQRFMLAPAHPVTPRGMAADVRLLDGACLHASFAQFGAVDSVLAVEPAWYSTRYALKTEVQALCHSGRFKAEDGCVLVTVLQWHASPGASALPAIAVFPAERRVSVEWPGGSLLLSASDVPQLKI